MWVLNLRFPPRGVFRVRHPVSAIKHRNLLKHFAFINNFNASANTGAINFPQMFLLSRYTELRWWKNILGNNNIIKNPESQIFERTAWVWIQRFANSATDLFFFFINAIFFCFYKIIYNVSLIRCFTRAKAPLIDRKIYRKPFLFLKL